VKLPNVFGRLLLCRFGRHTKPCGYGVDACARGCGFEHNPASRRRWRVTLRSGETYEVEAVNEYHAGSKVVFGDVASAIEVVDGKVVAPSTKVHRDNIESIELLT